MNDALVATTGDTYPYRAYLPMLLSYGRDTKETWLRSLEGWQIDNDGKYNAQESISLISRWGMIGNSQPFDFKGWLHSNMLLQAAGAERVCPVGAVV